MAWCAEIATRGVVVIGSDAGPEPDASDALIGREFARADCEHVAALLKSPADLPPVLASFLRLGAARNAWVVHGSMPHQGAADGRRLADAGLDVAGLVARNQLAIMELDLSLTPNEWVRPWARLLDERLATGFDALWFTRFSVGSSDDEISEILPFEEAWMDRFKGRPVVTLCPYIFGADDDGDAARRHVASAHDRVVDWRGHAASAA